MEAVVVEGSGGMERGGTANKGVEVEIRGVRMGEDGTGRTGCKGSLLESSCTAGWGVTAVGVLVGAGAGQRHGGGIGGAAMRSMIEKKLSIATKLKSSIVSVDTKDAILSTDTSIMLVNVLI